MAKRNEEDDFDNDDFVEDEEEQEEPKQKLSKPTQSLRKDQLETRREPVESRKVEAKEQKNKFVPFHSPERIGVRNEETGEEMDLYTALAEIINYLDRIEYYIGK